MIPGVCEFALWISQDVGHCFYRCNGRYYVDFINNKKPRQETTQEISKTEYLKKLSEYEKLLRSERNK